MESDRRVFTRHRRVQWVSHPKKAQGEVSHQLSRLEIRHFSVVKGLISNLSRPFCLSNRHLIHLRSCTFHPLICLLYMQISDSPPYPSESGHWRYPGVCLNYSPRVFMIRELTGDVPQSQKVFYKGVFHVFPSNTAIPAFCGMCRLQISLSSQ